MKIRGSVAKVVVSAAVVLVGSFLLVAGFRSSQNLSQRSNASGAQAVNSRASAAPHANDARILEAYGKLPLSFIENQGQTAQEVRYVSHGAKYDLFLTPEEAVIALRRSKHLDLSPRHRALSLKALGEAHKAATTTTTALHMRFEGANPNPQITGAENLPGKVNYYIGNDPQKWRSGLPTYAKVKYAQVYPGVDLVFYGNQGKLEYDFIVAPGTDPSVIHMNLAGARKLRPSGNGDVLISVPNGELQLQKPIIYQNINGRRHEIAGKYSVRGEHVSFAVPNYDRREPLIVDPVLDYSTYLGGTGKDNSNYAIAVDASGDAYVAGATTSLDFPLKSPLSGPAANAGGTGFVTEFNPTGTAQVFSTYLGGTGGGDVAFGLAIDASLNIYVTGQTFSTDFPVTAANALKPTLSTNASGTSFLSKISSAGALTYSTYLGGNAGDFGNGVAADANGNAYVTGVTLSAAGTTDVLFPVVNGFQTTLPNASGSAFLSRIDTTKSGSASLVYSTYLGGDGANAVTANLGFGDEGFGVYVDSTNKAYICGTTTSSNFPTSATTFQAAAKVANVWSSVFVSEIDTSKTAAASLVYSTYVGGSGDLTQGLGDFGAGIDVESGTTVAYVTGTTNSADFPLKNGFQTTGDANLGAAFVTLLDTSVGNALKYSTYLGNSGTFGYSIKTDATGNAYVGGSTSATSFPLSAGAYQTALAAAAQGDGFISEITPGGTSADLVYSTYFGGSGVPGSPDQIFGLALGTTPPTVYVTGETFSSNFPVTTGVFQTSLKGTEDSFVAKLTLIPTLVVSPATLTFSATKQGMATASQSITLTNNTGAAIPFTSATITSPTPAAAATDFVVTNTSCGTSIPAGMSCALGVVFTASTTSETATVSIADGDSSSPQTVALTGTAPAAFVLSATSLSFTSPAKGTATAAQAVTLTNNGSTAVSFTSAVVTSAGGFAADFALNPATTCGATIAASGGTCTVSVTYTPSVTTMETATLTITDGAGVQTVALTGTVTVVAPDFTVSAPSTLTVTRGKNGTATITVGSVGGFTSAVALTCAGQPKKSTCAIAPSSISPAAGGSATATLTLTTTSLVAPPPASPRFPPVSIRVVAPVFAALLMLLLFLSEQRLRTRIGLAGALLVFVALSGCASSGTPKGTSTLTITGTSGALTHTATITLTVD